MTTVELRCPRCKKTFSATTVEDLADELLAHVSAEHGHAPPRDHVIARIRSRND